MKYHIIIIEVFITNKIQYKNLFINKKPIFYTQKPTK